MHFIEINFQGCRLWNIAKELWKQKRWPTRSFRLRESRSPCRQSGGSVSAGYRSFGSGSYWEIWRGAEVFPHDPCQRNQDNIPCGGSGSRRGLKVSKAPGPKGFPNKALKHLPQRAVYLLVQIFNAILLIHHFPSVEARSSDIYT